METKELREQLKGTDEKYYEVTVTLQVDDETEEDKTYFSVNRKLHPTIGI